MATQKLVLSQSTADAVKTLVDTEQETTPQLIESLGEERKRL